MGQRMHCVSVLRLDQLGGLAPGNKSFKLAHNIERLKAQGITRVLSFGGAWSNHLHALAAVGHEQGLETIGVVRGGEKSSAMLEDAQRWGMRIVKVSREEYRQRNNPAYLRQLLEQWGPAYLLPEGGSNIHGVLGCTEIADLVNALDYRPSLVVVPVGTGTTLAGLAAGLSPGPRLCGISALKNAIDLEQRVSASLEEAALTATVPWQILHNYHCGGFARVSDDLKSFITAFEKVHPLPLEPVYTGKMMFAVHQRLATGKWNMSERLLLIHTGGLQGRRGYPWLD